MKAGYYFTHMTCKFVIMSTLNCVEGLLVAREKAEGNRKHSRRHRHRPASSWKLADGREEPSRPVKAGPRFLPRPNLRILSSSRYSDPLFFEASRSSRPPDPRGESGESGHKQNTTAGDNLGSPLSTSFPSEPLQSAASRRTMRFGEEAERTPPPCQQE